MILMEFAYRTPSIRFGNRNLSMTLCLLAVTIPDLQIIEMIYELAFLRR